MTRMRIHSPDPGAPPGSASRGAWTMSIEQGNLRMTGDGVWFDTRFGRAPDGTEHDVRPFRRGSDGEWVESATGRPVADANVRAALDQWDANMAASHIPLFPKEPGGGGGAAPPRGPISPPPEPPGGPPPAAAPESQPRGGTAAQAALGITGSSFTGDAARRAGVRGARDGDLEAAMSRLAAPDGIFAAKNAAVVEAPGAPHTMRIDARTGEPLTVKIVLVDTLPVEDGEVPVAKYKELGGGEYQVQISRGARPEAVERALAHELAEISARHKTEGQPPDALTPAPRRPGAEAVSKLSPHDEGRLAELNVLGRRLAELPFDSPPYRATLDEAQRLAAHLGLVGESEGVPLRQKLAREALSDGLGRAILENAITTALDNPFLQRLTGEFAEDMKLLRRRVEHARSLGEAAGEVVPRTTFTPETTKWTSLEARTIETIRQLLLREGIVTDPTETRAGVFYRERVKALASESSPGFMKLVDEAVRRATAQLERGAETTPPVDPASIDPHTAAATRALFGDHEHFQDWRVFLDQYGSKNKNDPEVLRRIFEQWANGSYVFERTGRARSLLSDMDRPSPGYEHRFLIDPARQETIRLPGDHVLTIFSKQGGERLAAVDDAVAERAQKMAQAAALRLQMNDPQTDIPTKARLAAQIDGIMQGVREISEALGVAAGVAFARERFGDGAELIIMRGDGVPDVLVRLSPTGPIVVIECKGGKSGFGTRSSVDGTVRVEQGTKEYLLSLATEMSKTPPDTAEGKRIRDNGRLLLEQLTAQGAPDTEYFVVRQPVDPTGPTAPEVGQFDTSGKLKKPSE